MSERLFIEATELEKYPNYVIDAAQKGIVYQTRICDICGESTKRCMTQYVTSEGKWKPTHQSGRFTSLANRMYLWIIRKDIIATRPTQPTNVDKRTRTDQQTNVDKRVKLESEK